MASIPAPGHGDDSGLTWAEGSLWVGQYRDRKIHQIDPADRRDHAHHRVQPLRHRRDLGRRRAVARHLGRRARARSAGSTRTAAPCSSAWRCRAAPASAGSNPTGRTSSIAAADRAARSARCAVRKLTSPELAKEHIMNTTRTIPSCRSAAMAAERKALLAREKELTRLRDQIARERRALPWERIDKDYVFDTPEGRRSARRPVRGPPPAAGAALHARPGLGARLPELLLHGRPHRRHERAPGAPRCHVAGRLARAAGRDRTLPPAHGLAVQVGVLERQRLQPRLRRQLHAGGTGHGRGQLQLRHAAPSRARKRPASACSTRTTRAKSSTPTRPTGAASR